MTPSVGACVVALIVAVACTAEGAGGSERAGPPAGASQAATSAPATATPRPTGTSDSRVATVEMGDHFFAPSALVVKVGTTVTWQLVGSQVHDINAFDGSFRSGEMGPGNRFSHTFRKPGRYRYFCAPHYGDGMDGVVIVEPADR